MKRFLFSILPLLGGCAPLLAQQVSVDDAMQKARGFWQQNNGAKHAPAQVNPSLAYTAQIGGEVQFYVFNNAATSATADEGNGFVIIGGDKRARQILGYCDHGSFDYETAPDNFKWWLSQYQGQIHEAIQNNAVVMSEEEQQQAHTVRRSAARTQIKDLISTKWDQGNPYNKIVKTLRPGAKNGDLVTGCVATAMAQVMKKWNHPRQGAGTYTYTSTTLSITPTVNFGETTYKWVDMLTDYSGEYTVTQADAVATLMYHAGVSVDMDYNDSRSGGSGAYSRKVAPALYTFFEYDKSALRVIRDYYTDEEWEDLVYSELSEGRPLIYGGHDPIGGGGHSFICHGYDATTDFYSFNWGWSGYCDGLYPLVGTGALQPNGNGIGGAGEEAAYTGDQDIIINLMPNHDGDYSLNILSYTIPTLVINEEQTATAEVDINTENDLRLYCQPWNQSAVAKQFQVGVMLRDVLTGECSYSATTQNYELPVSKRFTDFYIQISTSSLSQNGKYEVYPVYRANEKSPWQKMRFKVASATIPMINITGGTQAELRDITFTTESTSLPERQTMQITHDKYYDGTVTYTSIDKSVATVSETGLITALKEGTTTITASGTASLPYFRETSTSFELSVTPFVKLEVPFAISGSEVFVGEQLFVTHDAEYSGSITYTSSDVTVATVSDEGVITPIAAGSTTITAKAEATGDYKYTTKDFIITVIEPGFIVVNHSVANSGYVTPKTTVINATIKNNTNNNYSSYPIRCQLKFGGTTITASISTTFNSKETVNLTYDFSSKDFKDSEGNTIHGADILIDYINKTGSFTFLDNEKNILAPTSYANIPITICSELPYTYTMTSAGWGTLCLPFEAEIPEGLKAYKCSSATNSVLNLIEVEDKMEMDTPYLMSGTAGNYDFSGPNTPTESTYRSGLLTGVMVNDYKMQAGSYVLQMHGGTVGFYPIPESLVNTLATQYRAFLTPETTASMQGAPLDLPGDSENGIEHIEAELNCEAGIFDLNGHRRESLQKGMNIIRQADGTALKVYVQ